jgi:hypothetical protein
MIEESDSGAKRAWVAHMAGLRASYARHATQAPNLKSQRIEDLLDPAKTDHASDPPDWNIPNEIEILLVQLKTKTDLDVALDSAFLTAEKVAVPSFATLAKRREGLTQEDEKQALLAKLLRDTHNRYAERRLEREERWKAAGRMARLGVLLTGLVVGILIVLGLEPSFRFWGAAYNLDHVALARQNTVVCVFFGVLGAYLSRLIAFQNGSAKLSYDDLRNGYSGKYLFVRLLVGALSALIVYFVIAGRLIGGELFPAPEATGGFGPLWQPYDGANYTGPTANFAKLIVWSFIAGFSERFLPDSLSTLEAKSRT